MFFQGSMDGAAQIADSLSVDQAHLKDPALQAFRQIFLHDVLNFRGFERVQIQHAIDGKLDGLIHKFEITPIFGKGKN